MYICTDIYALWSLFSIFEGKTSHVFLSLQIHELLKKVNNLFHLHHDNNTVQKLSIYGWFRKKQGIQRKMGLCSVFLFISQRICYVHI